MIGRLEAGLGQEGLDDGRQQTEQGIGTRLVFAVRGILDDVIELGGVHHQHAPALGDGLLGQQHAAHVRMHDDRVGRLLRRLGTRQGTHLQAVTRIAQRILEAGLGQRHALDPHAETRGIHHGEHAGQSLVRRADQIACGGIEVHHAGRVAVNAHLVLDGATADAVALTGLAIGVGQELGYHEQRDATRAFRSIRQLGQHQMHDVLGQIVLTGRDEDLGAADAVALAAIAVIQRHGAGLDQTQVRAAMRFGQAHGAGPAAFDQLGQIGLLEHLAAVMLECIHRAMRQARIHAPRQVGGGDHFREHHRQ